MMAHVVNAAASSRHRRCLPLGINMDKVTREDEHHDSGGGCQDDGAAVMCREIEAFLQLPSSLYI